MKRTTALVVAILVLFGASQVEAFGAVKVSKPAAHATYALGSAKRCKAGYVKRSESHVVAIRVKVKGKFRTEDVARRFVACAWNPPKPAVTPTVASKASGSEAATSPAAVTPTGTTAPTPSLAVHLDGCEWSSASDSPCLLGHPAQIPSGLSVSFIVTVPTGRVVESEADQWVGAQFESVITTHALVDSARVQPA